MTESARTAGFMAMKGAGYYSRSTTGAKEVMDNAIHLVIDAVNRMAPGDDRTAFRVADMGAADGGTSIDLWRGVLKHVRGLVPSRPIEMVYTDLPRNDFSQVFRMIHGQTDLKSYYDEIAGLYVFASATSFHQAIFPPSSLDLGFSATASHYISSTPCNISNHVHMVGAQGAERAAFEERGRIDWQTMLVNRARELKPGGRLCLFNFGIDEEGRYLGHTGGVSMFDTFNELWAELAGEGVITGDEYLATNFPQCYRTVEQFTAPLTDPKDPVHMAGLRLEHLETRVVRCPFERDFTDNHKDADRFARDYLPTLRSWSEATFLGGLAPGRDATERQAIMDEFYGRYQARVAATPAGHAMDYVHAYLVCRKES